MSPRLSRQARRKVSIYSYYYMLLALIQCSAEIEEYYATRLHVYGRHTVHKSDDGLRYAAPSLMDSP